MSIADKKEYNRFMKKREFVNIWKRERRMNELREQMQERIKRCKARWKKKDAGRAGVPERKQKSLCPVSKNVVAVSCLICPTASS